MKIRLGENKIDEVLEILSSDIPELSYYDTPKDIVLISSRYKYIKSEKRRGTLSFEDEKLELNKIVVSLIEIVEEL